MGRLPLNITFNETLSSYNEIVRKYFAQRLERCIGTSMEIRLYEPDITDDFLKELCELEEILKGQLRNEVKVKYEICTTGTGLSEKHISYLKRKNITVCLLMDGPESVHERNNILLNRGGLHMRAVQAAKLLTAHRVKFYIELTVTSVVARNVHPIFSFFMKNGWNALAYRPVICETGEAKGAGLLSMEDYLFFLEQLFLLWKSNRMNGQPVYVREFENLAGVIKGYTPLVSSLSGYCPFQNVFFPDGAIYSRGCRKCRKEDMCDHLETQKLSVMEKVEVKAECRMCRWVSLCQSDRTCCVNSSFFCRIYKEFYPFVLPQMLELLRNLGR